ncbi:thioredoxin [Tenacibaculum skagerrakense]|uniref:Thioredoxin n=1 Tax=Tenacibaculum skagerrakense TaxID=186571 RepID=A0A4R2NTK2_9FLAO|nr:thioredoxin [Tenacibaculum skagerrakense]TCP25172.1 thioredoxin [Tenacibaculum skagerrakense]
MSNLTEILNGDTPVLIDFFAEWCGPCKMMTPVLKDLKDDLGDGVIILKIDVDKNNAIAAKYQIKGVPTFMIFKQGKMLWRQSGMLQKQDLIELINKFK